MRTKYSKVLTLCMAFVVHFTFAQSKTISGTITDESGLPLPGVNIVKKGSSDGTQTDFDGNYSIEAATGDILSFSYLGFASQNITIGSSSKINVSLVQDASELDEVVVTTALGIQRQKKSLGYSTQEVGGDLIAEARSNNALNALSGQVAGVQINNPSGNLGGSTRILLRGPGSITQGNKPLIVVDGIPLDNRNNNDRRDETTTQTGGGGRDYGDAGFDINPDDIESMNVLKGGAAAALYGSRANNGVIIITTKKAKYGAEDIIINSGISFESVNILPKVQKLYGGGAGNPAQISSTTGFNQATIEGTTYNLVDYATDESWGPRYDPNTFVLGWDAFDPEFPNEYLNPRPWIYPENDSRSFFQTGITYNNNVAFSKSYEDVKFRMSIGNVNTEGIVPNTELKRTTINFNGSANLSEKLEVSAGANYIVTEGFNRPTVGYSSGGGTSLALQFYQFGQTSLDYDRLKNYVKPDGTQRTWNRIAFDNSNPRFTDNPYWIINNNISNDRRDRFYGNLKTKYTISDKFYSTINIYHDYFNFTFNERIVLGSQSQSSFIEVKRDFRETNYEGRFHYDDSFNDDLFSINAFIGANRRDVATSEVDGNTRGGLVVPGIFDLNNSVEDPRVTDLRDQRRINSIFGSASFGFKNMAFIEFTGRNDWSSTLPSTDWSYFYPSISGSFVFSEPLKADWLSYGKIRGGWASVGNDTDPNNLITTFESRSAFLGGPRFSQPNRALNPDLVPEKKDTWEVGLEMAFLNNRIGFDVTYYNETTTNLITPLEVDPSTGYSEVFDNVGTLENKGIELLFNATPIRTDNFKWDLTWNFTSNRNKLVELIDGVETLQIARFPFNGVTLNAVVGEPYGVIRGTNFVFDQNGNKVVDANGRYLETQNVENLGSILPDYNTGLRNSFTYKNLNFSFLIDHQKGGKYRSLTNIWGHYSGILESTAANNIRETGLVLPGVTGDVTFNDDGSYTVANTSPNTTVISAQQWGQDHFFRNDNQNVFDADYFKLREVTLSYDVPKEWIGFLDGAKLSLFGRNLLVWGLDNENFDPEVASNGSGNIQGSEGGSLPSTRTYGFNVQLKF